MTADETGGTKPAPKKRRTKKRTTKKKTTKAAPKKPKAAAKHSPAKKAPTAKRTAKSSGGKTEAVKVQNRALVVAGVRSVVPQAYEDAITLQDGEIAVDVDLHEIGADMIGMYLGHRALSSNVENGYSRSVSFSGTVIASRSEHFQEGDIAAGMAPCPASAVVVVHARNCVQAKSSAQSALCGVEAFTKHAVSLAVATHETENTNAANNALVLGSTTASYLTAYLLRQNHGITVTHFTARKLSLLEGRQFDIVFDCRPKPSVQHAPMVLNRDGGIYAECVPINTAGGREEVQTVDVDGMTVVHVTPDPETDECRASFADAVDRNKTHDVVDAHRHRGVMSNMISAFGFADMTATMNVKA